MSRLSAAEDTPSHEPSEPSSPVPPASLVHPSPANAVERFEPTPGTLPQATTASSERGVPERDGHLDLDILPNGSVHLSIPLGSADPAHIASLVAALQARTVTPVQVSPLDQGADARLPLRRTDSVPTSRVSSEPVGAATLVRAADDNTGFVFPDRPRTRTPVSQRPLSETLSHFPSHQPPDRLFHQPLPQPRQQRQSESQQPTQHTKRRANVEVDRPGQPMPLDSPDEANGVSERGTGHPLADESSRREETEPHAQGQSLKQLKPVKSLHRVSRADSSAFCEEGRQSLPAATDSTSNGTLRENRRTRNTGVLRGRERILRKAPADQREHGTIVDDLGKFVPPGNMTSAEGGHGHLEGGSKLAHHRLTRMRSIPADMTSGKSEAKQATLANRSLSLGREQPRHRSWTPSPADVDAPSGERRTDGVRQTDGKMQDDSTESDEGLPGHLSTGSSSDEQRYDPDDRRQGHWVSREQHREQGDTSERLGDDLHDLHRTQVPHIVREGRRAEDPPKDGICLDDPLSTRDPQNARSAIDIDNPERQPTYRSRSEARQSDAQSSKFARSLGPTSPGGRDLTTLPQNVRMRKSLTMIDSIGTDLRRQEFDGSGRTAKRPGRSGLDISLTGSDDGDATVASDSLNYAVTGNSAHEMLTESKADSPPQSPTQSVLTRRSVSFPEFHINAQERAMQYARMGHEAGVPVADDGRRAEEIDLAWREVECVREYATRAAQDHLAYSRPQRGTYRRLLRGRSHLHTIGQDIPRAGQSWRNPDETFPTTGPAHGGLKDPSQGSPANHRPRQFPEPRQFKWESPLNTDPRAGVSPRRRLFSSITSSLVRLRSQQQSPRGRPGVSDTQPPPARQRHGTPASGAENAGPRGLGIPQTTTIKSDSAIGQYSGSASGSMSTMHSKHGPSSAGTVAGNVAAGAFAEDPILEPGSPLTSGNNVEDVVSPSFPVNGRVSKTGNVRGQWLEFVVQLAVESVISEISRIVRDLGHDVWRRGGEHKLRCTAQPESHGPPMYTSIHLVPTGNRRGTLVRLRRARADRQQTKWWRYVSLHRELMARFDVLANQRSKAGSPSLSQPLRIGNK